MNDNEIGKLRRAARKYEEKKKNKRKVWNPPGQISDKTKICTHDYTGMLEIDRGPKDKE